MAGRLYILPSPIFDYDIGQISPYQKRIMVDLRHYAIENIKPARRFIKKLIPDKDINECSFWGFGKHDDIEQSKTAAIQTLKKGEHVGLLSDAGAPGIADPGNVLVREAHRQKIVVEPISGPSSIFMALMASGLNGQQFRFHGYLPQKSDSLKRALRQLEQAVRKTGATQIFIETPYRNRSILDICQTTLQGNTLLSIACDLGNPDGFIITRCIKDWSLQDLDIHKRPSVFLIGA